MNKHVVNSYSSLCRAPLLQGYYTHTMIGTSRYLVTYGAIKAVKMGMERELIFVA